MTYDKNRDLFLRLLKKFVCHSKLQLYRFEQVTINFYVIIPDVSRPIWVMLQLAFFHLFIFFCQLYILFYFSYPAAAGQSSNGDLESNSAPVCESGT
jgi:hypothetical protein